MCMRVCVCVCARARVCVCVSVWMCVCACASVHAVQVGEMEAVVATLDAVTADLHAKLAAQLSSS